MPAAFLAGAFFVAAFLALAGDAFLLGLFLAGDDFAFALAGNLAFAGVVAFFLGDWAFFGEAFGLLLGEEAGDLAGELGLAGEPDDSCLVGDFGAAALGGEVAFLAGAGFLGEATFLAGLAGFLAGVAFLLTPAAFLVGSVFLAGAFLVVVFADAFATILLGCGKIVCAIDDVSPLVQVYIYKNMLICLVLNRVFER